MVTFHLLYDLVELFCLVSWRIPTWAWGLSAVGGKVFILLSGICATLGSRPVKRGMLLLGAGMGVSAVTVLLYRTGFGDESILIYFGVLHCLGCCMLLWPLFRRLGRMALLLTGLALMGLGWYVAEYVRADSMWLLPFGVLPPGFATADYFPLLPNLGFFLTGGALGRTLYRRRRSLFAQMDPGIPVVSMLRWVGKRSLPVYLFHQPVLTGICMLLEWLD